MCTIIYVLSVLEFLFIYFFISKYDAFEVFSCKFYVSFFLSYS